MFICRFLVLLDSSLVFLSTVPHCLVSLGEKIQAVTFIDFYFEKPGPFRMIWTEQNKKNAHIPAFLRTAAKQSQLFINKVTLGHGGVVGRSQSTVKRTWFESRLGCVDFEFYMFLCINIQNQKSLTSSNITHKSLGK